MPGRASSRRAITILEILIVLVVLSLLAATTVRHYFGKADVTLESASVLLVRDIRAAQHRSIFLGEKSQFFFLPDGAGYVVTDTSGTITHNPQTDEPFLRCYPDDGVFVGVTVVDAVAGDDRTLEIDEYGRALEDLSVTIGFGEERRTIVLSKQTGTITIEGSTSGWVDQDG